MTRETVCLVQPFNVGIVTMPAQLVTAFAAVDGLYSFEGQPEEELKRYQRMLRRIVLSALPVVASAANVDLSEIDGGDALAEFADREFLPEGGLRGEVGLGRVER